ncbi:MAG: 3-dehydroquinate synthase [Myxococcales bacterium]|nr:3-dehydroquinate synthase [Myxococcales bacterium]
MQVFVSGPMGSGKSSVAPRVAGALGVTYVDLDAEVTKALGMGIAEYFRAHGEASFRGVEARVLGELLDRPGPRVVALGGGTVTNAALRRRLLAEGVLVTLMAPAENLAARVGRDPGRPLLGGRAPVDALGAILRERASAYAECHGVVPVADRPVDAVASDVIALAKRNPVAVPLGARTYAIDVGRGVRRRVVDCAAGASAVLVVADTRTREPWGREVATAPFGVPVASIALEAGEVHKHLGSVERIWDAALDLPVDRHALLVAVGGGVVGDVTGFAASTVMRGVAFGQVPTTVVAMVDSAVGGKTGIDRVQGKNLVGTFHQPRFVLADVEALTTLPVEERAAGLAEVVKSAWLDGEASVALVEARAEALRRGDLDAFVDVIRMSVALKARIVSEDETESGPRMLLNLGHTVGHALEAGSGYALRHGEAVALGMVAAFRVARSLGHSVDSHEARMIRLLGALGLPTDLDAQRPVDHLDYIRVDKKRVGKGVRFVLPGAPGTTEIQTISAESVASAVVRP